jgi:hypothetical protein
MNTTKPKHFKPLNQDAPSEPRELPEAGKPRLPLAACDCDEHCNVDICAADEVDVDVCGMYGG